MTDTAKKPYVASAHPLAELFLNPEIKVTFPRGSQCVSERVMRVSYDNKVVEWNIWDSMGEDETEIDAMTRIAVSFLTMHKVCTFADGLFEHYLNNEVPHGREVI